MKLFKYAVINEGSPIIFETSKIHHDFTKSAISAGYAISNMILEFLNLK